MMRSSDKSLLTWTLMPKYEKVLARSSGFLYATSENGIDNAETVNPSSAVHGSETIVRRNR